MKIIISSDQNFNTSAMSLFKHELWKKVFMKRTMVRKIPLENIILAKENYLLLYL